MAEIKRKNIIIILLSVLLMMFCFTSLVKADTNTGVITSTGEEIYQRDDGSYYYEKTGSTTTNGVTVTRTVTWEVSQSEYEVWANADYASELTAADFGGGQKGKLRLRIYNAYSSIIEPLSLSVSYLEIGDGAAKIIEDLYDLVRPLSYGLVLVYFLIELCDHYTSGRGETDYKFLMWLFVKLAIVEELIRNGKGIINIALNLSNYLIHLLGNQELEQTTTVLTAIKEELMDYTIIDCLAALPTALIVEIIAIIPKFMLILHAVSRTIELVIRSGLLPLALPDLFSGGVRSGGMMYIKKLAAVACQGFMMLLIVQVAGKLSALDMLENFASDGIQLGLSSILNAAMFSFAAVGLIGTGKQMINDVFGVH